MTDCNLTAKDGESLGMCVHGAGLRLASQKWNLFDLDNGCVELNISEKLIYFKLCIITIFMMWGFSALPSKEKSSL